MCMCFVYIYTHCDTYSIGAAADLAQRPYVMESFGVAHGITSARGLDCLAIGSHCLFVGDRLEGACANVSMGAVVVMRMGVKA